MIEFKNEEELYEKIYPILKYKTSELQKIGFEITAINIWKYLSTNIFPNVRGLTLYDISHEIIHIDINKVIKN